MSRKRKTVKKFLKRMQKKLIVIFLVITAALIGLIGRLMYIERVSGEKYEKIVLSQQEYDSRIIPYQRGDIVDTKGTRLATSLDVYNVVLDCYVLNHQKDDIDATVSALATCFPELKEADIYQTLKEKADAPYEVLLRKLSYDEIQPFVEMQADSKTYPHVNNSAVWFEKEYVRSYPYGSLAASVIGFVSGGNVGTVGLENYYNSTLNGLDGRQYGYLNADNNFEKTVREAKDGNTIVSTIDAHIQGIVEEKLAKYNEENENGAKEGPGSKHIAAIVMNPQNAQILAMANLPTFDLNNPREISAYYTDEEIKGLDEKGQMDLLNQRWENFCVTYTYEPGSTVKPLTVACGLDTGTLSGNETYVCDGVEDINGSEVHCVSRVGHGTETVEQSLMDSCNDALMQMSYTIGNEHFYNYQNIYGFGQRTGIDLPGEERGLLNSSRKKLDLATNSFGQNFNCTMIQLACAFSSLINGGRYYQPHIVRAILDSEGNAIETVKPVLLKETTSEETSKMVRSYLNKTVSEGTGKEAKVNGYSMGGKTGTAQKYPREDKTYLVSFIGYVPAENPQLVIYVIIDEPNVEDQAHSNYAQGVAREILEEVLPYMNIYPDEELVPEEDDPEGGQAPEGGQVPEGGQAPEEGVQTPEGGDPEGDQAPGGEDPEGGQAPEEGGQMPEGGDPEGGQAPEEGGQTPEGEDPAGSQPLAGEDPNEPPQDIF